VRLGAIGEVDPTPIGMGADIGVVTGIASALPALASGDYATVVGAALGGGIFGALGAAVSPAVSGAVASFAVNFLMGFDGTMLGHGLAEHLPHPNPQPSTNTNPASNSNNIGAGGSGGPDAPASPAPQGMQNMPAPGDIAPAHQTSDNTVSDGSHNEVKDIERGSPQGPQNENQAPTQGADDNNSTPAPAPAPAPAPTVAPTPAPAPPPAPPAPPQPARPAPPPDDCPIGCG
jgi:hypothetical protein